MEESHPRDAQGLFFKQKRSPHRSALFWMIIVVLISAIVWWWVVSNRKAPSAPLLPVVTAASAKAQNVPVYIAALGNVTPTDSVTVKTQINGQLLHVYFKEGQMVKTGDLLAEIDPRPYLAQLTQYEGQLMHDQALLDNANIDLKRYQTLWKKDSVSQQTLATQIALVKQYEGNVKTDEGLIEATRVNLIYCHITSPIDGRVGLRLVDPGNFVQTTDTTGIVVINALDPITVIFSMPEDDIPKIMPQINADRTILVLAYDRSQTHLLTTGTLLTIDNQINTATGTVNLRAVFDNKNGSLFPNQFVNIELLIDVLDQAVTVPTAAIQHGAQGDYVYLVHQDHTVSVQNVQVGPTSGENSVILSGLTMGQAVVTEGADKLTAGIKVSIATQNELPPSTGSPLQVATRQSHWHFLS